MCQSWAQELGFSQIGVTGVDLSTAEPGLSAWLAAGFHGSMHYMQAHGLKRARPTELVPGTVSIITVRMNYLPALALSGAPEPGAGDTDCPDKPAGDWRTTELGRLQQVHTGTVSVYARGRDYHKVLRSRLQKLADRLQAVVGPTGHRVFTDSAPVLEVELATRSGQGWRGKHTLLLHREAGSMYFLGELFVDLPLPETDAALVAQRPPSGAISLVGEPPLAGQAGHCGSCTACLGACPTQAIVAPYRLDARRCISYLTIEHDGPIPTDLRPAMANRIYGCDDCQLVCPWNKFAQPAVLADFDQRTGLNGEPLAALLAWTEASFLQRTEGTPIRRIGHERWLRNVAVAAGNALRAQPHSQASDELRAALLALQAAASPLVREHVDWALAQHQPARRSTP